MKKIISLSAVALLLTGCVSNDIDNYRGDDSGKKAEVNLFDFSTVSDVKLTVDYSASKPTAPIFFKVYSQDPFVGEEINEDIKPVYAGFTDAAGQFSQTVELPSYATDLYVFTGDFFVDEQLMNVKVTNKAASAVAGSTPAAARRTLSQGSGVLTDDLSNFYQLSYEVNYKTGAKLDNQIYNDWKTWLGKWDSRTGRPEYLMQSDDEQYNVLTFDEEDMKGIRQSIAAAIVRKETCPIEFRKEADLTLQESSAVSVTLVGSNTCWNNTIGYYYYQGDAPKNLKDIHVVMLFPNTQDGHSQFIANPKKKYYNVYNGNIALERGETVQLVYYPYIAQNNMEGATPIFPAGTKIGFLLKANGWGMQLSNDKNIDYSNGYKGDAKDSEIGRQYNCWSASTDGLSYCEANNEQNVWDKGSMSNPNPQRKSRTAKFAYEKDGQQYAIVAFEDAANNEDYGDVILALKPVGLFQKLPVPTSRLWSSSSVYAYEDLWPSAGDYDMNDALVEVKEDRVLTMFTIKNKTFLTKQTFNLTTYQNRVTEKSGLALTLETDKEYPPTDIKMKKILRGEEEAVEANFIKDGNVYLLTDDIKDEINTTYILELTYQGGVQDTKSAKIKPFIYRDEENGKRWEVHIPMEAPTAKMNTSYFGTESDRSNPSEKLYFVGEGNYPFAFQLKGVGIDVFENTILLRDNEKKAIDVFFPDFLEWSKSKGENKKDWYLNPVKEQEQ